MAGTFGEVSAPGGDLRRIEVGELDVAENRGRMAELRAQLPDRGVLGFVLGEEPLDQLREPEFLAVERAKPDSAELNVEGSRGLVLRPKPGDLPALWSAARQRPPRLVPIGPARLEPLDLAPLEGRHQFLPRAADGPKTAATTSLQQKRSGRTWPQ